MDSSSPTSLLSNKRKANEKRAVRVKVVEKKGDVEVEQKNGGPPPDSWSWRKYGQKPIRGSPYPRSYYRCSTVKGCPAKKQLERCKEDVSVLIITYTAAHNHHGYESKPRDKKQNHQPKKKAHTEQVQTGSKGQHSHSQQSQLQYMQSNEADEWLGKVDKEEACMVSWDSFNPGTSSNSADNLAKGKKEHRNFGMSRFTEDSCELFDDEWMSFMTWASPPLPHVSLP